MSPPLNATTMLAEGAAAFNDALGAVGVEVGAASARASIERAP